MNIVFLLNVTGVKAIIQAVLMQIYLMIKSVQMLFVVKTKALMVAGNVKKINDCNIGFFSSLDKKLNLYVEVIL